MRKSTNEREYTERLLTKQFVWWKRLLDVQRPYRNNINKLDLGFTLDIGCGIGRNLLHIKGNGVGIDHNKVSVKICKEKGLVAYTKEEFFKSEYCKNNYFDSILLAHVAEHMTESEAISLLKEYLPFVKVNGKLVVITPQEAGYASDETHIQFTDFKVVKRIFSALGVIQEKFYSFPFPRFVGKVFKHNEFISVARKN
ncbi:class I SAM-dependent methyltransferase [Tenacibaculum sp. SZ-18]|uniref:class I SAM-dependent methyltransferase n=1 Tax=Tenacibaculum sp. SZ-18 TaxID=754423 RepID=UPI000C2D3D55|nr:class I SAM-dependent methyltransferase [Tenacibaculum sp. SZ-18]